jgi:hypothetical protein
VAALVTWLRSGADPRVVQRVLGHASAAMTMDLYGHLIDRNLWAAGALFGDTAGTRADLDDESGDSARRRVGSD